MSKQEVSNYYDVLGIKQNSSENDIKKAYHALAVKYHPDKNTDSSAEEMFKIINEAYNVLINKDKRHQYDISGIKCDNIDLESAQQIFDSFFQKKSFDAIRGRDPYKIRKKDDYDLFVNTINSNSNISMYVNGLEIIKTNRV